MGNQVKYYSIFGVLGADYQVHLLNEDAERICVIPCKDRDCAYTIAAHLELNGVTKY